MTCGTSRTSKVATGAARTGTGSGLQGWLTWSMPSRESSPPMKSYSSPGSGVPQPLVARQKFILLMLGGMSQQRR